VAGVSSGVITPLRSVAAAGTAAAEVDVLSCWAFDAAGAAAAYRRSASALDSDIVLPPASAPGF